MKTRLAALLALVLTTLLACAGPARATGSTDVACPGVSGWYVNPDETDRKPETTIDGFTFGPADLIHRETSVPMVNVKPGSFALATGSDTPDQPSFFSVEVRDADTGAYGTLRWDGAAWTLVTNTASHTKAEPIGFVGVETKWGKLTAQAKVISFGVGYTKNPPGTKNVTVKSVTFAGQTYRLMCTPPGKPVTPKPTVTVPTPTTTPGATSPTTVPPTKPPVTTWPTTAPTTRPPATTPPPTTPPATTPAPELTPVAGGSGGDDGSLPVTGAAAGIMGGIALIIIGVGGVLIVASRRRKLDFES